MTSQLLVVSNTGNWEYDMWGVVTAIPNETYTATKAAFHEFCETDSQEPDATSTYIETIDGVKALLADNEVNFFCSGEPISAIVRSVPDCFDEIYFLVELP